jgi:hypothetical protein
MGVARRYGLVERMRELGAEDPEGWARSELTEDIPQEARWLVLRQIWRDSINGWTPESIAAIPAAQRAVGAGADAADVAQTMRAPAYEAAFGVLSLIDEGYDPDAPAEAPGWVLAEIRFDDREESEPSRRTVDGLHEDLLGADPCGREGADLWE